MHTIKRVYEFSAAHRVEGHPKCGRLHGHNYTVEVTVAGPLNDQEMVLDFADLDKIVKPLIDKVDHRYLVSGANIDADDPFFKVARPSEVFLLEMWQSTAESLAAWFASEVDADVSLPENVFCYQIVVQETGKNYAIWNSKPD